MNNAFVNKEAIVTVANALGEMNDRVIYVGGAVIGLYVNDDAGGDVRPTKDVDIALQIATAGELEQVRKELTSKGFTQHAEEGVICRFRYKSILVDIMSTTAVGWAPANPWFAPGFEHRHSIILEKKKVNLLPLPYFLATKLSAYGARGANDPRTSHDFEDIVYLLDNISNLSKHIVYSSPDDVRTYLRSEFCKIIDEPLLQEAIRAHLPLSSQEDRFTMIMDNLKQITSIS